MSDGPLDQKLKIFIKKFSHVVIGGVFYNEKMDIFYLIGNCVINNTKISSFFPLFFIDIFFFFFEKSLSTFLDGYITYFILCFISHF